MLKKRVRTPSELLEWNGGNEHDYDWLVESTFITLNIILLGSF